MIDIYYYPMDRNNRQAIERLCPQLRNKHFNLLKKNKSEHQIYLDPIKQQSSLDKSENQKPQVSIKINKIFANSEENIQMHQEQSLIRQRNSLSSEQKELENYQKPRKKLMQNHKLTSEKKKEKSQEQSQSFNENINNQIKQVIQIHQQKDQFSTDQKLIREKLEAHQLLQIVSQKRNNEQIFYLIRWKSIDGFIPSDTYVTSELIRKYEINKLVNYFESKIHR